MAMDDDAIRTLVTGLARPHPGGGAVIERAAILAAGADFSAVMTWIVAHRGEPEVVTSPAPRQGLHGARGYDAGSGSATPLRFVLPPGALN